MALDDMLKPRWTSSALLSIDMQVDFAEGGASPVAGTAAVAPHVEGLVRAYRQSRLPIVHVVRLYTPGSSDVDLPRRQFVETGGQLVAPWSEGSSLLAGLAAQSTFLPDADVLLGGQPQVLSKNEAVLYKPRWGAFYRTGLDDWLRLRGVSTVVVAGCNLPNCPRATLFEASERDYRAVLAFDAVSQVSPERLSDLSAIGVTLLRAEDIIAMLALVGDSDPRY